MQRCAWKNKVFATLDGRPVLLLQIVSFNPPRLPGRENWYREEEVGLGSVKCQHKWYKVSIFTYMYSLTCTPCLSVYSTYEVLMADCNSAVGVSGEVREVQLLGG